MSYLFTVVLLYLIAVMIVIDIADYASGEPECLLPNQEDNAVKFITQELLEENFKTWEQILKERQELEKRLAEDGRVILNSKRTDLSLNRNFKEDPLIQNMELSYLPFEEVSNQLYQRFNLSDDVINNFLPTIQLIGQIGREYKENCMERIATAECDTNLKYRRIDGQCNNLQNPKWGMAKVCQPRLFPPNYVGTSGFRISVNGEPLPSPRTLSLNIHNHVNRPTNYVNHMYMFFGQILTHDITQTPQTTTVNNQAIQCCPVRTETHPQCAPIVVREDDPFYSQFNVRCLNFVRSVFCPTCTLGPKQIMNEVTSAIDASVVYGSWENRTHFLRANDNTGRMRTQNSDYGDLLPRSSHPENDQCSFPDTNEFCFEAGDSRVNQHTILASLHTIFLREHNRIATDLNKINPHWDGEKLFLEARRIVEAELQAIVYQEYLPITLNDNRMSEFRLWAGSRTTYDSNEDLTILLEFSTAAFRFGHSLINSVVTTRPLNSTNGYRLLRNEYFQPFPLYTGLTGPLVEGTTDTPAQSFDRHLVPDVRGYLYKFRNEQSGMDLAATNIKRGRDHGMPTYVDTVRGCTGGRVNIENFEDLVKYEMMAPEQAIALQSSYRFVQDIDLWTGILCEINEEGGVVGPTAAYIIGLQFHKLKYGDRFYFEHGNEAGSFTDQQLQELRSSSLSKIICLNAKVERLPENAMLFRSENNPYMECSNVNGIDLSYWKE